MKTIVIATGNAHKVEEFNRLAEVFSLPQIRFVSAKDVLENGMPHVVEDSGTFLGNARLKAQALKKRVPADFFVLADDSGLCVDALDGAPGVETAYYAGPEATAEENRHKLLAALDGVPAEQRGAHFVCLLLLISPDDTESVFEARCHGSIATRESGNGGFGYDPIFVPQGFSQTFAELDGATKDRLSHRGNAFAALARFFAKD
ncbi:MAG: RdgB/HAM1 family non-canonical purine NTP pyrophosphatase [Opitutales bacterium]|nr:RdgB/HAM1 family non-canonical purine NTP pyrophosphatase [Opitutales bacterium]